MQGVSVYISTLSLTAIALDRLHAVSSRMVNQAQNRRTVTKIVLINLISVLAILPYSLHMEVIKWAERGIRSVLQVIELYKMFQEPRKCT